MNSITHTWTAKWINPELVLPDKDGERPASYIRKSFTISRLSDDREPVILYATAHGTYQIYINGEHVEGFVMAPGTSEYSYLLQYQAYDVTDLLQEGENEILAVIGNGWWRGTITYDGIKNGWGEDVAFLAELVCGEQVLLATDGSWEAAQDGPVRDSDNMQGETFDARLVPSCWHPVTEVDFGYDNLVWSACPSPIEHETFSAKLLITPNGERVLDFGQNIAGYVSFSLTGEAGKKLELIHGETLDGAGNFCIDNFQSNQYHFEQKITYICKDGQNTYRPTATFMGFRYVLVNGDLEPDPSWFQAHAVYSDLNVTAQFHCGNELVNQLFANSLWSIKGNLLDIPTDCPTREKSGFTGDLVTYIHTFQYLMDCYPMIEKFITNQAASQREDGCVKQIVADPRPYGMMDGAAGWSDSIAILPWKVGQRYNNYSIFEENYEHIKAWADYCIRSAARGTRENHRDNPWHEYLEDQRIHWGEWLEPGMEFETYFRDCVEQGEPEVGTAYLSYTCQILAKYADRTGRKEDAAYYGDIAQKARLAYRWQFTDNGTIHSDRMCRYVRPIVLNLLSEEEKARAAADLNDLVKANSCTLNTGFLTTHELCRVLSDYGYTETAYNLLLNEQMPGWLYSVRCGATTVPENWCAYQPDGTRKDSFNHYSYGSITGWLMDTVLGIRLEDGVITICPRTDIRLQYAEGVYDSPVGRIESSWKYDTEQKNLYIKLSYRKIPGRHLYGRMEQQKH